MLQKDGWMDGRKEGWTDGSVTISLRNFIGEGIIKYTTQSEQSKNLRKKLRNRSKWIP
jgi:hypothetical protein